MSAPAAGGAREQVARLLALVPWLHVRDDIRIDEAAAALGVTPQQLVADLRVLFMCGLPGGYPDDLIDVDLDALEGPEGDGVIRVSNADYLSRPLRLTPTEATALIVALRALRAESAPDTAAVVDRALAKLEAAAAEGGPQIDVGEPDAEVSGVRAVLTDAIGQGRQVRLSYYVPARDEESERVVDPYQVFVHADQPYLRGWCHRAEALRIFRLDRVHAVAVLDTPIETDPTPAPDLAAGWFASDSGAQAVVLRLDPQARWVPEYFPVNDQRELPDGGLEVTMLVADPWWIQRLLLRLAPHATVVAPHSVREEFAALARRTLSLYG